MKFMISMRCGLPVLAFSQAPGATAPIIAGATSTTYTTLAGKAQATGQAETAIFFQEQALVTNIRPSTIFEPASLAQPRP